MGRQEFVEVKETFGFEGEETEKSLEFQLALPARKAESFSLNADTTAVVYSGTRAIETALTSEWSDLEASLFGGEEVRVRIGKAFGSGGVEIAPADASRFIEKVELVRSEATVESQGYMSDSRSIIYSLDVDPGEANPGRLKLTLRIGLKEFPLRFEVKDLELP